MELETPRAWLQVLLELRVDGTLVVGVGDDTGRTVAPLRTLTTAYGWPPPVYVPMLGFGELVPVRWPDELQAMLRSAVDRVSQRQRSDQVLASVPVFVDAQPGLRLGAGAVVQELLIHAIPALAPRGIVVTMPQQRDVPHDVSPFSLPLDVLGVGERGAEVLSSLKTPWFAPDEEVQPFRASASWLETPSEVPAWLATGALDILVIDAVDAAALSDAHLAADVQPVRLAVVLGVGSGGVLDAAAATVPFARSVISVPGPADPEQIEAVRDLFRALSHDLPLHEVVADVRRRRVPRAPLQLVSTPDSVHDLRLTSAWEANEGLLAELSGVVGAGAPLDYQGMLSNLPREQRAMADVLVQGVVSARGTLLAFRQETEGLYPLSGMTMSLRAARAALDALRTTAGLVDQLPRTEPRVVNLGLRRREGVVAAPFTSSFYLDPRRTLAAGASYALDVQIGAPWEHTLVQEDPREAEIHLPDEPGGVEVEIVVFAEDDLVEGHDSYSVLVPRLGPTDIVSFDIRTPTRPGTTWLRVGVYHRGSLVQTLRLDLMVTEQEEIRDRPVLVGRLDHSTTRDWTNLPAVRDRDLSLVLNAGPDGGHHLTIKGAGIKATVPVGRAASTEAVRTLRQTLMQTVDPQADAADVVWRVAEVGEGLRYWVTASLGKDHAEALRQMATTRDRAVQVVRIDHEQAFPWALLYDWTLPEHLEGDPRPAVCFGTTDAGDDCGHQAGAPVVCVRGFWGIRHRVEELISQTDRRDTTDPIRLGDPGILMALGVEDEATKLMRKTLSALLKPIKVKELTQADGLLDTLFQADRPGVVVLLGHNETRTMQGQPKGPRILLSTSDKWFHGRSLYKRWDRAGRWSAPHSLVLLLSCGSAAPQPTELTSYLSALREVSAGAVIGTQCDVRTGIAVDFALEVLRRMTDATAPQPLADAVRQARCHIVIDGKDPRGFLFDAYGPADLTLVTA